MEGVDQDRARRAVHRATADRAADGAVPQLRRWEGRVRGADGRYGAVRRVRRSRGRLSHPSGHGVLAQRDGRRRQSNPNLHRRTAAALMKAPSLTMGIEEEYQIIDPETRELR